MTKFQSLAEEVIKEKRKFTKKELDSILEYFGSLEYDTAECQHGGEYGRCITDDDISVDFDKEMDYVCYTDSTLEISREGKLIKIKIYDKKRRIAMAQSKFGYYFVKIDYDKGIITTHRYSIDGELTHTIERKFR